MSVSTDMVARRAQRGMGFVSLLLLLAVVVLVGGTALKAVPAVFEYMAIKRATTQIATQGTDSALEIQKAFDRYAAIEDITSIAGRDLVITRANNGLQIAFAYERRVPMVGPMSLLFEFQDSAGGK